MNFKSVDLKKCFVLVSLMLIASITAIFSLHLYFSAAAVVNAPAAVQVHSVPFVSRPAAFVFDNASAPNTSTTVPPTTTIVNVITPPSNLTLTPIVPPPPTTSVNSTATPTTSNTVNSTQPNGNTITQTTNQTSQNSITTNPPPTNSVANNSTSNNTSNNTVNKTANSVTTQSVPQVTTTPTTTVNVSPLSATLINFPGRLPVGRVSSITVQATGGTAPYTYTWYEVSPSNKQTTPAQNCINGSNVTVTTNSTAVCQFKPSERGPYYIGIHVTDANNNTYTIDPTVLVGVYTSINPPVIFGIGRNVTFTGNATGASAYYLQWSVNGTFDNLTSTCTYYSPKTYSTTGISTLTLSYGQPLTQ